MDEIIGNLCDFVLLLKRVGLDGHIRSVCFDQGDDAGHCILTQKGMQILCDAYPTIQVDVRRTQDMRKAYMVYVDRFYFTAIEERVRGYV